MIILCVGMRAITTAMLSRSKKSYDKVRERLHGVRSELGFEKERQKSAADIFSFNERQKDDLVHRIDVSREDLRVLQSGDPDARDTDGDDDIDLKLPKHLRPRGEDLFG